MSLYLFKWVGFNVFKCILVVVVVVVVVVVIVVYLSYAKKMVVNW